MRNNRIKIAVTSVGGGVGQSIVKSLSDSDYYIIGLDANILSAGLYAVPAAYIIPRADELHYIDSLLKICEKEKCRIIFPGSDTELPILSRNTERFAKIGATVVISRPEVIDACNNKLQTFYLLSENKISVVSTVEVINFIEKKTDINYPIIIKPKIGGSRSQNVFLIKNEQNLFHVFAKENFHKNDYIVQEYIDGNEYTCGSINLNGRCHGVIIMRRILRDGDTYKCFVEKNKTIEEEVLKVMRLLKPFGACNVQLRLRGKVPYIFEINARCSGTTAARAICGFNEPKIIADYICYGKKPTIHIKKLSILRYWKELVAADKNIKKLQITRRLKNPYYTKL